MRTSIYLAVAFVILFISLSDAAVYKRQPGSGTPSGSGFAKSISNGMKTRRNMLQRRSVDRDQKGVDAALNAVVRMVSDGLAGAGTVGDDLPGGNTESGGSQADVESTLEDTVNEA